jgi:hypothetical protein
MEPRLSAAQDGPMEPEFPDGTRTSFTWKWNRMGPTELWGPGVAQCSRKLGGGRRPSKLDFQIPAQKSPEIGSGATDGTQRNPTLPAGIPRARCNPLKSLGDLRLA